MPDPVNIRGVIGLPPEGTARAFDARGDLRLTTRWSEMWHEDHARAFTVAKVADLDLLETIRTSLADAAHNGATFEQWQKNLVPMLQRAGWWGRVQDRELTGTDDPVHVGPRRLRTIYSTNMRVSRAAGQWARIQAAKAAAPYLRYVAVMDRRTRPLHRAWHGTILPVDHEWWQTHFPPNGWNCRCTVMQLSEADLRRFGFSVSKAPPPAGPPRAFFRAGAAKPEAVPAGIDPGFGYNPGAASADAQRGRPRRPGDGNAPPSSAPPAAPEEPAAPQGERSPDRRPADAPGGGRAPRSPAPPAGNVVDVPEGIDPGFAYNPGEAPMRAIADKAAATLERAAAADLAGARAALRELVDSPAFAEALAEPGTAFPVMILADELRDALGARARVATLSADTVAKQRGSHPEIAAAEYRRLPDIGAAPDLVFRQDDRRLILMRTEDGRWLKAVVKATEDRGELFVVSLAYARAKEIQRLRRRHALLFGQWVGAIAALVAAVAEEEETEAEGVEA